MSAGTPPHPPALTLDELRARLRTAGLTIPEERLEMVRVLLSNALAPLRAVDSREIRTLEPAVTFDAARAAREPGEAGGAAPEDRHGR